MSLFSVVTRYSSCSGSPCIAVATESALTHDDLNSSKLAWSLLQGTAPNRVLSLVSLTKVECSLCYFLPLEGRGVLSMPVVKTCKESHETESEREMWWLSDWEMVLLRALSRPVEVCFVGKFQVSMSRSFTRSSICEVCRPVEIWLRRAAASGLWVKCWRFWNSVTMVIPQHMWKLVMSLTWTSPFHATSWELKTPVHVSRHVVLLGHPAYHCRSSSSDCGLRNRAPPSYTSAPRHSRFNGWLFPKGFPCFFWSHAGISFSVMCSPTRTSRSLSSTDEFGLTRV